jgi:hypothetical protein
MKKKGVNNKNAMLIVNVLMFTQVPLNMRWIVFLCAVRCYTYGGDKENRSWWSKRKK